MTVICGNCDETFVNCDAYLGHKCGDRRKDMTRKEAKNKITPSMDFVDALAALGLLKFKDEGRPLPEDIIGLDKLSMLYKHGYVVRKKEV